MVQLPEGHAVVVFPVGLEGVAGVAMVAADVEAVEVLLVLDGEGVVQSGVGLVVPVDHLDPQHGGL